ncbi:hypothetical protein LR48_Vigan07g097100 [Vigna angularis]|uniref:Uncharacterized protein n=1 Tax=Phaseolus angularis TaxID=3914 RepID=A0A0L9UXF9_PHAAN|nr:hypothetical protein LR48_Vigan07g097100 [Vigna angularis]
MRDVRPLHCATVRPLPFGPFVNCIVRPFVLCLSDRSSSPLCDRSSSVFLTVRFSAPNLFDDRLLPSTCKRSFFINNITDVRLGPLGRSSSASTVRSSSTVHYSTVRSFGPFGRSSSASTVGSFFNRSAVRPQPFGHSVSERSVFI